MRKALAGILVMCASMAQADEVVIAALGDSLTQGYGLVQDEGFVPQLQQWLVENGAPEVRLINAGVSGDTTAGGLSRVGWTLEPEVDGMIVTLGGNDILRGLDPAQARSNIDGILQAAGAADVDVLLVGLQAPPNFGAQYKTDFDRLYPDLAETYGTLYFPSFFTGLSENGELAPPSELREWFQADGIHPNAQGVARIVAAMGPAVLELVARIEEE
ncbi:arylesterase [Sulfitobacter sp.]|uniref:arylesterase n=1 Tax=Sulfitobacter sp. TaxID=1903071 RepID=UPI003296D74B